MHLVIYTGTRPSEMQIHKNWPLKQRKCPQDILAFILGLKTQSGQCEFGDHLGFNFETVLLLELLFRYYIRICFHSLILLSNGYVRPSSNIQV